MLTIFAAISLGFLGSFHCLGMCGPIALALPVHQFSPLRKHLGVLFYNLGRLFTYALLGLFFGLLGQTFFPAKFQQALSISIGLVLLLSLVLSKTSNVTLYGFPTFHKIISKLKSGLALLFQKKGLRFLFLIGLLNGLLPCGLVYMGIAGATASGTYLKGALFMLGFGLGTLPAMYSVAFMGQFINVHARNTIRKAVPLIVASMAILLILRGLNLGIPYVSPAIEADKRSVNCCVKENHCAKSNSEKPVIICRKIK